MNGSLYLRRKPKDNPLSYKGLSNIHQLLILEEGMFFRQRSCTGYYFDELTPVTKEELDTEYINFLTFLEEAEYIGRRGKMTKESLGGDVQFLLRKPIVLYRGKEHIILYSDREDFGKLRFANSVPVDSFDYRYVQNWEIFGEQTNIYRNPKELYRDLVMDSLDLTEEKGYQRKLK
jgi:hypothetical protein